MKPLNKLIALLLLLGICLPSYAAVHGIDMTNCSVYSDDDKKGDKKEGVEEEEEEEPDCE